MSKEELTDILDNEKELFYNDPNLYKEDKEEIGKEARDTRRNNPRNQKAREERMRKMAMEGEFRFEITNRLENNLSDYINQSAEVYETRFAEIVSIVEAMFIKPISKEIGDAFLREIFDEYMSRSIEELQKPGFGDTLNSLYDTAENQKELLRLEPNSYVQVVNLLITGQPENSADIIEAWAKRKKIGIVRITGADFNNSIARGVPLLTILSALDTCPEEESILFIDGLNRASQRVQDSLLRVIQKKKIFDPSSENAEHKFSKMLFTIATLNPSAGGENEEITEPGQAMYTSFCSLP